MKAVKKLAAWLLMVTLLFTATACGSKTSWAYKQGNDVMAAGQYINYQINGLEEFLAEVEIPEDATPRSFKDVLKYQLDGKTGEDWVNDFAQRQAFLSYGVKAEFQRLGLEVPFAEEESLRHQAEQAWENEKSIYEANGISFNSFYAQAMDLTRRDHLFAALYEEGGEREVAQEEIKEIFLQDFAKADVIQMSIFSEETEEVPGEFKKQAIALGEEYLQRIKEGETPEEIMYEYNLANASEEQKDQIEMPEQGSLSHVTSESTKYVFEYYGMADLAEQILATKGGEPVLYEGETALYIIVPRSLEDDSEYLEYYETTILFDLKHDEFEETLLDVANGLDIEVNEAALKRYKPSNLKEATAV